MSTYFSCPVCQNGLVKEDKSVKCKKGHSFDFAKSGYVNLLLSKGMNTKTPGDNKLMVQSRKNFLSKGYYSKFAAALCDAAEKHSKSGAVILDAGCGEGYYTEKLADRLQSKNTNIFGVDISKAALEYAAKREKRVNFAVASVFHLPFANESLDGVLSVFAPYSAEEFHRVLRKNGTLIIGAPGARHLWELKKAVYEKPYLNEAPDCDLPGFELASKTEVSDRIFLPSAEDIGNLFAMTPYLYKTPDEGKRKLSELNELETEISFEILMFRKK